GKRTPSCSNVSIAESSPSLFVIREKTPASSTATRSMLPAASTIAADPLPHRAEREDDLPERAPADIGQDVTKAFQVRAERGGPACGKDRGELAGAFDQRPAVDGLGQRHLGAAHHAHEQLEQRGAAPAVP